MGFYDRKSVNVGPFRVNLSKSGGGYSVVRGELLGNWEAGSSPGNAEPQLGASMKSI
jgi:hypothetical protein